MPLFRVKINLKKAFKVLTPATAGGGVPLWVLAAGVGFATFLAAVVYFANRRRRLRRRVQEQEIQEVEEEEEVEDEED